MVRIDRRRLAQPAASAMVSQDECGVGGLELNSRRVGTATRRVVVMTRWARQTDLHV